MNSIIELTHVARRHAEKSGLSSRLENLSLEAGIAKGDIVEFPGEGKPVRFIVRERRLRVEPDGRQTLIFVLDYPPRPALL